MSFRSGGALLTTWWLLAIGMTNKPPVQGSSFTHVSNRFLTGSKKAHCGFRSQQAT
jgi:hypothetical protein